MIYKLIKLFDFKIFLAWLVIACERKGENKQGKTGVQNFRFEWWHVQPW